MGSGGVYQEEIKYPCWCYLCDSVILTADQSSVYISYWSAKKLAVCKTHSDIEIKERKLYDAYECQIIDADCNDCKHFKRGNRIMIEMDDGRMRGSDSFHGQCMKFDRPTIAHVNFSTGHKCFEHRKSCI